MKSTIIDIWNIIENVRYEDGRILVICQDWSICKVIYEELFTNGDAWRHTEYHQHGMFLIVNGPKVTFISKYNCESYIKGNEYSGIIVVGTYKGVNVQELLSRLRYKTTYKPFLKFVQL